MYNNTNNSFIACLLSLFGVMLVLFLVMAALLVTGHYDILAFCTGIYVGVLFFGLRYIYRRFRLPKADYNENLFSDI